MPSSLTERIAQLISIRIGSNLPPVLTVSQDVDRVARVLDRCPLGSLVVFNGGRAEEAAASLESLQRRGDIPLLVAMDMENGSGQQVVDHVSWPHGLAFDALGDDAAAAVEQFGLESAREASSIGIHVSFSPVLDIHRNPANPIIATRAFGTNAIRVIELAESYVRGCHAGGLLCCGKHFPGHGNTTSDSHEVLPIVQDPASVLAETDLVPFRKLVEQQIDMLMTAHVAYPALDPTGAPATLSRPMLDGLLRKTWGYAGLVVSDSFKMQGIRLAAATTDDAETQWNVLHPEAKLAIQAIRAGVDLLLDITDVDAVVEGLARAAEFDDLLRARIEESFQRMWAVKVRRFGSSPEHSCFRTTASDSLAGRAHADRVAERAIHSLSGEAWTRTWDSGTQVNAVLAHPCGDQGYRRTDTLVSLLACNPAVASLAVLGRNPTYESASLSQVSAKDTGAASLVVLLTSPDEWPEFGIPAWQFQLIEQLTSQSATVVVSLGIKDVLTHYPLATLRLATFSDSAASQRALVKRLFVN